MRRATAADLYEELERRYPELCRRFIVMGRDLDAFPVQAFLDRKGVPSFSKPFSLHAVIQIVDAVMDSRVQRRRG